MISLQTAILLLLAAIAIYALELFVPSAGALFVIGTICLGASVVIAFLLNATTGAAFTIVVCLLALFLPGIGLELWKRSPIGRRMLLTAPGATAVDKAEAAGDPPGGMLAELSALQGEVGITLTPLRPAGIAEIAGRRVDTVAEGVMIDKGVAVRVVEVRGNRVVVRERAADEAETQAGNLEAFNKQIENWNLE